MPSYDLGTAKGEVVLDFDQTGIDEANKKVSGFGAGFKKAAGIAAASLALVGAGVAAIILKGGLDRALNIQDAQKKLEGLGHSTQAVQGIMTNALAAVKGTAFGLDEAATVAATAVAAGIQPGKDLTKYLKLTADAATIAGTSLGDMGAILNQAHTQGVVFTSTLDQLAQRGIPVFQYLQQDLHVTGAQLTKLVTTGKISADELDKVLWQHLQGSALASGETTRGALANVGAAFSRLGAAILSGPVNQAPALLTAIARAVDRFAAAVLPANTALNKFISDGMVKLTHAIDSIDFTKVFAALGNFVTYIRNAFNGVDQATSNAALPSFLGSLVQVMAAFGPVATTFANAFAQIAPAIANVVGAGVGLLPPLLNSMATALGFVANHSGILTIILAGLIAQMVLSKIQLVAAIPLQVYHNSLLLASTIATRRATTANLGLANAQRVANGEAEISNIQLSLQTTRANLLYLKTLVLRGATLAWAAAQGVLTVAQEGATAAAAAFSTALDANPISLIILAVAALVAGLVLFFTQTQVGKDLWSAFVGFITTSVQALGTIFAPVFATIGGYVNDFVTGFQQGWGDVMSTIQPVVSYVQSVVVPLWQQAYAAIVAAGQAFWKGVTDAWGTIQTVVAGVVTWFQANVAPVISTVMTQVQGFITQAIAAITQAWQTIQPAIQPIVDFFQSVVLPNLGGIMQTIGVIFGVVAGIIAVVLLAPLAVLAVAIGVVIGVIVGLIFVIQQVIGVIQTVAGFITGVATTIYTALVTALGAVIDFISGVVGTIVNIVTTVVGAVQTAIANVVAFFAGVVAAIAGFVNGIVTAITTFFQPLVDYFNAMVVPVIQSAVNAVIAIITFLVTAISYGFQVMVANISAIWNTVIGILTGVWNTILGIIGGVLLVIVSIVSTQWNAMVTFINNAVNTIRTIITTVWNAISSFISGVLGTIQGIISTVWGAISSRISSVLSTLSGIIHTVFNAISTFVGGIVKTIVNNAVSFFTPIVSRVSGVMNSVLGAIRGVFNTITGFVGGAVKTIVNNAVSFFSPIVGRVKSVFDGVVSAVKTGIGAAMTAVGGIKDKIVGFFAGAGSWLAQAGRNIMDGLLGGLKSMFDNVTGFFDSLTSAIPKHKGPPSRDLKLLEGAGKAIMTGLANGLESKRESVLKQLDNYTNDIAKGVGKGVQDRLGIFTTVGKSIADNLVQSVKGSKTAMDEYLSDLTRNVAAAYDTLAKQKADANKKLKDLDSELKGASKARRATLNKEIADQKAVISELNKEPKSKSTVVKVLQTEQKALDVLAKQRDDTATKLAAAQDKLTAAINQKDSFNTAVQNAVKALGDITKATGQAITNADGTTSTAAVTVKDMIANLQDAVTATAKFQTAFNKLKSSGLNNTSLQQLVENFDQTGSADLATTLASSGADQIAQLNSLQAQLEKAGDKLGTSTSNALYNSGIAAAQGIVDGLKAKEKDLQDEMTRLADTMVKQLKKELGIKSPSTVMHKQIGVNSGLGIVNGLKAMYKPVAKAASGLMQIPQGMLDGFNPATLMNLSRSVIPGVGATSASYDNSQRTLIYNAAPGTQQYTAETSLFEALTQGRARTGW